MSRKSFRRIIKSGKLLKIAESIFMHYFNSSFDKDIDYRPLGTPLPLRDFTTPFFELLRPLAFDPNWSSSRIPA